MNWKELRSDFRIGLLDLIEQYREDHDKQAFKTGYKLLKQETKTKFKELRQILDAASLNFLAGPNQSLNSSSFNHLV